MNWDLAVLAALVLLAAGLVGRLVRWVVRVALTLPALYLLARAAGM